MKMIEGAAAGISRATLIIPYVPTTTTSSSSSSKWDLGWNSSSSSSSSSSGSGSEGGGGGGSGSGSGSGGGMAEERDPEGEALQREYLQEQLRKQNERDKKVSTPTLAPHLLEMTQRRA